MHHDVVEGERQGRIDRMRPRDGVGVGRSIGPICEILSHDVHPAPKKGAETAPF